MKTDELFGLLRPSERMTIYKRPTDGCLVIMCEAPNFLNDIIAFKAEISEVELVRCADPEILIEHSVRGLLYKLRGK